MAQIATKKLDSGDTFPELKLNLVNGTSLTFPKEFIDVWSVLLIYRGSW